MTTDATVTHTRLLVDEDGVPFLFYRDVVGLTPTFGDAESGYADFETGDVTLALFDAAGMADAVDALDDPRRGRDQVCVVLRVDDVQETAAALRERGVDVEGPPTDHPGWGIRTVRCREPDGTLVEFNEPFRQ
jgi:predicted enzyme related to lactoylglutathione lyase